MKLRIERKRHAVVWHVGDKCRRVVKPIAKEFGLNVEQFLTRHSEGSLPGQIAERREKDRYTYKKSDRVEFYCGDPSLAQRIKRAAAFDEKSVVAFVMEAIMSYVESCEEDMIVSPKTSKPIGDELTIDEFREEIAA